MRTGSTSQICRKYPNYIFCISKLYILCIFSAQASLLAPHNWPGTSMASPTSSDRWMLTHPRSQEFLQKRVQGASDFLQPRSRAASSWACFAMVFPLNKVEANEGGWRREEKEEKGWRPSQEERSQPSLSRSHHCSPTLRSPLGSLKGRGAWMPKGLMHGAASLRAF